MIIINNHHLYFSILEYLSGSYFKGYEGLGGFCSSLSPVGDGYPADQALWSDLLVVIKEQVVGDDITGFHIMIEFLKAQANMGWDEINEFLEKENLNNVGNVIPPAHLAAWHEAIKKGAEYEFDFE